ncbi:hypothetical protein [Caulobacter sp. CCH5-E12]|uniref:hypothetical protein n=1 Tax=Caulobacter sp. CCH5-E12 TaxID=1768770 RepID=UPI0007848DFA|nr:hypothetical protein [Caulobacter sp. CCH5-E12]
MQTDSNDREPQVAAREDIIYEQRSNEFRSLNTFFWQIPLIMMTLNGGLWYAVATLEVAPSVQRLMLWFAAGANIVMAIALVRLRSVMGDLLERIRTYEGRDKPKTDKVILALFCGLFLVAALGAMIASRAPEQNFLKAANAAKALKAASPSPAKPVPAFPPRSEPGSQPQPKPQQAPAPTNEVPPAEAAS